MSIIDKQNLCQREREKSMNQRIYGDDLTNNEHPFTKGMKDLVKNLNAVDDIVNKNQKSNVVTVVQSISQLKQE